MFDKSHRVVNKGDMSHLSIVAIVNKFGGQSKMAAELNANSSTVGMWKQRGSIPSKWWPKILDVAKKHQICLEPVDLLNAQTQPVTFDAEREVSQ